MVLDSYQKHIPPPPANNFPTQPNAQFPSGFYSPINSTSQKGNFYPHQPNFYSQIQPSQMQNQGYKISGEIPKPPGLSSDFFQEKLPVPFGQNFGEIKFPPAPQKISETAISQIGGQKFTPPPPPVLKNISATSKDATKERFQEQYFSQQN